MPFDMFGGSLHQQLGDDVPEHILAAVAYQNAERLFGLTPP